MASDTSSDIDINIFDNHGNNMNIPPLKKETSESDLYLNLIANPSKSREASERSTSSLNFNNDKKDSETSSVKRMSHHSIKDSVRKPMHYSDHHRSDTRSEKYSDKRHRHSLNCPSWCSLLYNE